MAGGIDWFRWHHGSVTDPKFALIGRRAGASLPDVLAVWAFVLETASAAADRGYFGTIDAESLDCLFNFPNTDTRTADILAALDQRGLTKDGYVVAWEKRQPKREREGDSSADRTRAYRERQAKGKNCDANVTPSDASVTPLKASDGQETPREEERRGEKNKHSPDGECVDGAAAPAPAPAPTKASKPKKTPKTSIPADFGVSDAVRAWAGKNRFDRLDEHLEAFRLKVAANSYTYANWDAAFMNAIRDDWARLRVTPRVTGFQVASHGVTVAHNPQYEETQRRLADEAKRTVLAPDEVARLRREREARRTQGLAA